MACRSKGNFGCILLIFIRTIDWEKKRLWNYKIVKLSNNSKFKISSEKYFFPSICVSVMAELFSSLLSCWVVAKTFSLHPLCGINVCTLAKQYYLTLVLFVPLSDWVCGIKAHYFDVFLPIFSKQHFLNIREFQFLIYRDVTLQLICPLFCT